MDNITRRPYLIIGALALLLYSNTLFHGFVLDDDVVIVKNSYVQKGWDGIVSIFTHDSFAGFAPVGEGESLLAGGRYRPLSIVLFAMIYAGFEANPLVYHVILVLLFVFASMLLFRWLKLLLADLPLGNWAALAATLIFVAHPVHTEVVANIKSMDEVLALAMGASSLYAILKAFDSGKQKWMWIAGGLMFLGCLAKENVITLIAMGPLMLWLFRQAKFSKTLMTSLPLLAGALLFLWIRHVVLGDQLSGSVMHDPLNNPFLVWNGSNWIALSIVEKMATILYTFGQYVRLMIFPYPLTHDYYPFHIQVQSFSSPFVWTSLISLLGMTIYSIWGVIKRKIAVFGILFFLITLSPTINIFFPVGTFMAERFLFLPSIGICLVAGMVGINYWIAGKNKIVMWSFGAILILFSGMTIMRNAAWKSNETLFITDVKYSPQSAKLQNDLGTMLLTQALAEKNQVQQKVLFEASFTHLEKAVQLHPTYYDALLAYGACAYYLSHFDISVKSYRTAMDLSPQDIKSQTGLAYALQALGHDQWTKGDSTSTITALTEAWTIRPDTAVAHQLSRYYRMLNQEENAMSWSQKASQLPRN